MQLYLDSFISLVVTESLDIHLIDVVIIYLYRLLDNIYMKSLKNIKIFGECNSKYQNIYFIKLERFLYGLKQFRRM